MPISIHVANKSGALFSSEIVKLKVKEAGRSAAEDVELAPRASRTFVVENAGDLVCLSGAEFAVGLPELAKVESKPVAHK